MAFHSVAGPSTAEGRPPRRAARATILVIDDSRAMRRLLSVVLAAAGFEVLEAENSAKGLGLLGARAVDLVITDINMPGLNGFGLIERVRRGRRRRDVPILVLTSESDEDRRLRGLEAGAAAWLLKPFSPGALIREIGALLA